MKIPYKTIEKDDEYLRQVSKEVNLNNDDYIKDTNKMIAHCREDNSLLALAAVQIGIPKRIIYLRKTDLSKIGDKEYNEDKVLINPEITNQEGLTRYWESCASCLNNMGLVERPYKIELEYFDEDKNKCRQTFSGFSATVIAHEMDHLDGILHIDKSLKIYDMKKEDRVEFRKKHPYKIISKDCEFKK